MGIRENVTLLPDPRWSDRYEEERKRILNAAGDRFFGVFHVGSTAVPDVPGKPALDILAVFADYESARAVADTLTEEGFEIEHDSEKSEIVVLVRWEGDYSVIVKIHTRDDEKVRNQLIFREYLRENPDARREYERVKREAAAEHPEDLEAYTKAKTDVVLSLLERARDQEYAERLPEFA